MKKLWLVVLILLVTGLGALGVTFTPETLPVAQAPAISAPEAHPPEAAWCS